jgi:hypothetical protein
MMHTELVRTDARGAILAFVFLFWIFALVHVLGRCA